MHKMYNYYRIIEFIKNIKILEDSNVIKCPSMEMKIASQSLKSSPRH